MNDKRNKNAKSLRADQNHKKMSAMALILVTSMSLSLFLTIPIIEAHTPPWTVPTYTYISVRNSVLGVNQDELIVFWCDKVPVTAQGAYGDRWTFNIEIRKPDGSIETAGPFTSDPVGGGYALYKPTMIGNYTFVAKFVEKVITGLPKNPALPDALQNNAAYVNDTYLASASNPVTVSVVNDPIQAWTEPPMPTGYWTRPINSANRGWYTLAANWLAQAAQNVGPTASFGYGRAPETAHVLWSRPTWVGGIMDARYGDTGYQTYHYEGLGLLPPIIIDGKLFYNVESIPREGWYAVDLYTGETLYFHNTTGPVQQVGLGHFQSGRTFEDLLSFGQIYNYESPNQHGGFPYLWAAGNLVPGPNSFPLNTWKMFDAYTGNWICSIANVSLAGTLVYGKEGSILRYNLVGAGANRRLTVWNTSRAIWYKPNFATNTYWMWRPSLNATYDGNNGFSLNVSIPNVQGTIRAVREGQFIIGGTQGINNEDGILQGNLWALSLAAGEEGKLLWNRTFTPPSSAGNKTIQFGTIDPEDGVFIFRCTTTVQRWGFSLDTMQQLWGPTDPEPGLNYYGMVDNIYQGKLLTAGYGGELNAYDIKTGKHLWKYVDKQIGFESPYGNYPISIGLIADGKIYIGSGEHSPSQPLWRGSHLICVNASNGAELWKYMDLGVSMPSGNGGDNFALGDGYLVALNAYDNKLYCIGIGPSQTTVTVNPKVAPLASEVLIEGTVTDQSPGAKGAPAIADADQELWMEYLYQQQQKPTNVQGVAVRLTAIDPNGNFQDIGTVVSDINGQFSKMWTPPVEGKYVLTATFEGTKSYGGSYAQTAFGVTKTTAVPVVTPKPSPTATQPPVTPATPTPIQTPISPSPTEVPQPPTSGMQAETYIVIGTAVVVIVALAAALVLRKRR